MCGLDGIQDDAILEAIGPQPVGRRLQPVVAFAVCRILLVEQDLAVFGGGKATVDQAAKIKNWRKRLMVRIGYPD